MKLKPALVLGFFVANLLLVLFMWWQNSAGLVGAGNYALALGRLTGLVGTYLVLWQLVLISRAPWVEHVFGFDKLTRLHHTNGQIALITNPKREATSSTSVTSQGLTVTLIPEKKPVVAVR